MLERNPNSVWTHVSRPMAFGYVLLALTFALCAGLEIGSQPTYLALKPFIVGVGGLVFLAISAMAVRRCADQGPGSIGQVCFWSAVLLGFTISLMYLTFFLLFPDALEKSEAVGKFLNIPPVIAAVWAAGIGWYVHFQATAKAHRTNNAFNLLMQTRTSKEFLDRQEQIQRYFPHGCNVTGFDRDPDNQDDRVHLRNLEDLMIEVEAKKAAKAPAEAESEDATVEAITALRHRIGKVKAQLAIRYMLNFYEVMAVAIAKKDLDEDLLYDSLGASVPSLFRRAESIVAFEKGRDKVGVLIFSGLAPLVERWERRNEVARRKAEDKAKGAK